MSLIEEAAKNFDAGRYRAPATPRIENNSGSLSGRKVLSMCLEGVGHCVAAVVVGAAVAAALVAAAVFFTVGIAAVVMGKWGTAALVLGSPVLAVIAYNHFSGR
jgi:hypothetical protein